MTLPLIPSSPSPSHPGVPRRIAISLFALSGWLVSGPAHAQPAALTLHWEAPAGCPQQAEVRERIRTLTGTTSATATVLQAEGRITRTDSAHFHLKLIMRSGALEGERNLDATSCENLSGAAAVSLALLMRSEEPIRERDLEGEQMVTGKVTGTEPQSKPVHADAVRQKQPEKPSAPDKPSASVNEPAPRLGTPSEARWGMLAQVPQAALSFGPLPEPSWGVAFAGGLSYERWRLLLGGSAWLRQNVGTQAPGYGAEIDRVTGTLRACHALRRSAFEVAPCLVLSLEHISARGTGPDITARSEQTTWLGVGAGAQARLYLASWVSVLVGIDAQIETARPVISIDGVGKLGELGPAAFAVTVGPEWSL